MVKSSTLVVLKDVDPFALVSKHYSVVVKKELDKKITSRTKKALLFLDPSKSPQKIWITMFDLQGGALPMSTSKKCHNCHHGFKTAPLGLPLKYIVPKTREDIDRVKEKFRAMNINSDSLEYFETEGYYCSFPCVKNMILEKKDVKYKNSLTLLHLLYYKLFGVMTSIPRSPSYKLLNEYGGHMSIDEFRGSFGALELTQLPNLRRPFMFSTSSYFLEKKI